MCEDCYDTLTTHANGIDHGPCVACLTTPATEEIRAVAEGAFGDDFWACMTYSGPWWLDDWETRILPLYLPAGRDLAVRVLAFALCVGIQRVRPQKPR